VQDTTFTASPSRFIASAVVAAVAWTVYLLVLARHRRNALRA